MFVGFVLYYGDRIVERASGGGDQSLFQLGPFAVVWMMISGGLVIFNKDIFTASEAGGFGFPFVNTLMLLHLFCASMMTWFIRAWQPAMMPAVSNGGITAKQYFRNVFPIGVLLSLSVLLGNKAYLYLSVSYIQMIKAGTTGCVHLFSLLFGIEQFDAPLLVGVMVVTVGVAVSSVGEAAFVLTGFILQSF